MAATDVARAVGIRRLHGAGGYVARAIALVWTTNRRLAVALAALSGAAGVLPVAVAYLGKLIIDGTIVAADTQLVADRNHVLVLLGGELILVALLLAAYRGLAVCEALLRVELGQRVTELVLGKALTLGLADFENPEVYDRLSRARQHAASRPLGLVRGALSSVQEAITLAGYAVLLFRFSVWLVLILVLATLPSIFAEIRLNADAFRLFKAHTPETRKQEYLETVLSREDFAKEVKLYGLGGLLLDQHRGIFTRLYAEDRRLALARGAWGLGLSLLGAAALAVSYAWVAWAAIDRRISVGDMAMLFVVLKQAQSIIAVLLVSIAGMYEDNLYMSTLQEVLDYPVAAWDGVATAGIDAEDGIRFEDVSFTYPDRAEPALVGVTFHVPRGSRLAIVGANGAGKSTLVKLLSGLYRPDSGRVLLDGRDIREWDRHVLAARMAVLVQDFPQYQLPAGHNVGLGDTSAFLDRERWESAARAALVHEDIAALASGYDTQLGRWFATGQELSLGQWQRVALARVFMRRDADVLVFDEPTAKLDATAEAALVARLRDLPRNVTTIVISHRFTTARLADRVVVLDRGRLVEEGRHDELVASGGTYASLHAAQTSPAP